MPPNQRVRFHDGEGGSPVNEASQNDERDPCVSSARRGLTPRSAYRASCFRRNRFSASWERDRKASDTNLTASSSRRPLVRQANTKDDCFRMRKDATGDGRFLVLPGGTPHTRRISGWNEYLRSRRSPTVVLSAPAAARRAATRGALVMGSAVVEALEDLLLTRRA